MVKLTTEYLMRNAPSSTLRLINGRSKDDFIKKTTHLKLHNKHINEINNLRILNASDNGLHSISDLVPLQQLTLFMAQDNELNNMEEVLQTVSKWPLLRTLEMSGNPLSVRRKYRESLIAVSVGLELLDGKEVSETTRAFLKRLELTKMERRLKGIHVEPSLPCMTADIDNLTKHFTPGVRKSISRAILREGGSQGSAMGDGTYDNTFPPWHKREQQESSKTPNVPRLFWRQQPRARARKLEYQLHLPKII